MKADPRPDRPGASAVAQFERTYRPELLDSGPRLTRQPSARMLEHRRAWIRSDAARRGPRCHRPPRGVIDAGSRAPNGAMPGSGAEASRACRTRGPKHDRVGQADRLERASSSADRSPADGRDSGLRHVSRSLRSTSEHAARRDAGGPPPSARRPIADGSSAVIALPTGTPAQVSPSAGQRTDSAPATCRRQQVQRPAQAEVLTGGQRPGATAQRPDVRAGADRPCARTRGPPAGRRCTSALATPKRPVEVDLSCGGRRRRNPKLGRPPTSSSASAVTPSSGRPRRALSAGCVAGC